MLRYFLQLYAARRLSNKTPVELPCMVPFLARARVLCSGEQGEPWPNEQKIFGLAGILLLI
jgi:hypothetical protein